MTINNAINWIRLEPEKRLISKAGSDFEQSISKLPHPWHIEISDLYADSLDVYHSLVKLHTRGDIKIGDFITGTKHSSLKNISYFAKIFAGEYDVIESELSGKRVQQTLIRKSNIITANIRPDMPASRQEFIEEIKKHGHILVRFGKSVDEQHVLRFFSDKPTMDYRYGNTARKNIKESELLQVTAWPKELMLPAHNEMTYHFEFPQNLIFMCKQPSKHGGETSIYDCAKAFKALSKAMKKKVINHSVICYKRYVEQSDHNRYPSWKQILDHATSCEDIIEHFASIGYQCQKIQESYQDRIITVIETSLTRPMVYRYQDKLCLHASMVPLLPYWYGQLWPNKVPPLTATWDNGEPITPEEFHELDDALLSTRISYGGWQKHDVLILDNPRIAHGRLPFIGSRVIGVFMNQPIHFDCNSGAWEVSLAEASE